jgi:hypothetical protein
MKYLLIIVLAAATFATGAYASNQLKGFMPIDDIKYDGTNTITRVYDQDTGINCYATNTGGISCVAPFATTTNSK